MKSSVETIKKIDEQIIRSDSSICRHIEALDCLGRGAVSQDILSNLRTFVEHIMFKVYAHSNSIVYDYSNIKEAIAFVKTRGQLYFLWKFHEYLQIVASHYSLDSEDSERVMLKYYEFMLKTKEFLKTQYDFNILCNLEKFPLNTDKTLEEYYEKIAIKLNQRKNTHDYAAASNDRYYIHKIKPFFVHQKTYYEVTFFPTAEKTSKYDRIIAFTKLDILNCYAVKLWTAKDYITIIDKSMPIFIITNWEIAIRPIEIERFSNMLGESLQGYAYSAEARGLMSFLQLTGLNIVELLCLDDKYYQSSRKQIITKYNAKVDHLFKLLDLCRSIIINKKQGCNVLRYLLYHMNNRVITDQLSDSNDKLSGLCLSNGCIPFDDMPFCTSLLHHNPRLSDLFDCIDVSRRMHEVLARHIIINTERKGVLYTSKAELERYGDVDSLVGAYNSRLYHIERHQARRLKERNGYLCISGCENDTVKIINMIIELSKSPVQNYISYVEEWLNSGDNQIDCEEKKKALLQLFAQSSVAVIYGAAGTGKSTMINHISNLFSTQSKLYLANTNPAVDNMKRRVTIKSDETDFLTVAKFVNNSRISAKYDILIIDECSTVSNHDMLAILQKAKFDLLVLVGDIYQIEAIDFGNWFYAMKGFLPCTSVYELTEPYRSRDNKELQILWDRVRNIDDRIVETITRNKYSASLEVSIFEKSETDEMILCLNYDGLYGINNINRFLQEANPHPSVEWGLNLYKIGDPVLFNESERFKPIIYNNVKGWISGIRYLEGRIQFDIEVDKQINGLEARSCDFELLPNSINGRSVIRFSVDNPRTFDDNREVPITAIVPFQVAYAISIHKAQGLEYKSVKIVITDEIEDHITHSIFYTAITRAREKLKIYWTPEVEHKILSTIKPRNIEREVIFLKEAINEKRK